MVRYFRSGQSEAFRLRTSTRFFRSAGAAENLDAGFAQGDHHRDRKASQRRTAVFLFQKLDQRAGIVCIGLFHGLVENNLIINYIKIKNSFT